MKLSFSPIKCWLDGLKNSLLAVDISANAIKLVEITKNGSDYCLESYAVHLLPPHALVDHEIRDLEVVGEAIRAAYQHSQSRLTKAACAVGGSAVMTKIIQMPSTLSAEEIALQIRIESDKYIPFPLEEISMDFSVLETNEFNHDMVDVLLAVSRTEHVEARVDALALAGLHTKVMDIEAFAIERVIPFLVLDPIDRMQKTIAVIDIGVHSTVLHVIHRNQHVYSREQNIGIEALIARIERQYGWCFEDVFQALHQGNYPDDVAELLIPFEELMIQHIQSAIQLFLSSSPLPSIDKIFLAGRVTSIPGLEKALNATMSLPVFIANPFAHMTISKKIDRTLLERDAPLLVVGAGLALWSYANA